MAVKTWAWAGAVAALAAVALVVWRDENGRASPETSVAPVAVVVGGRALEIPRNALRFDEQRTPGVKTRLDIALAWPELTGRSAATAARFDTPDLAPDIVYLTLTPRQEGADSATRLTQVYARFFVGEFWDGPGGLQGRRLSPKSGYAGEEVWLEPGAVRPFVARCYPLVTGEAPSVCLHDVTLGALTVSWRFPKTLLGQWREIDAGLDQRLGGWGVETR